MSRKPPWGYRVDPDDDQMWLPIPEALDKLEEAKKHLKQFTQKSVHQWLVKETGIPIALRNFPGRLRQDAKNRKSVAILQYLIARTEELRKKAEEAERKPGIHSGHRPYGSDGILRDD